MSGCLEVVEYSLKEGFDMKYLHQVSYLRLQDVISVCLSYCRLSGTTPGIISAFARCNWCVYHTAVYPVQHQASYLRLQDVIGVCLSYYCLSGTTCVLVVVQYTAVYPVQRVYLS